MRFVPPLASVLFACAATLCLAQPSFDCAKASSDAEDLICSDAALAEIDQRLAARFLSALSVIDEMDAGKNEAEKSLRATQRGWIKGRDDCWKAEDLRGCIEASYLTREAELVAMWMLEEPASVAVFSCENNPANEVAVFFFDTEQGAIRLEYGDSVRPGWRVPAASGAKYETPFGGSFWTQGNEAMFYWVEVEKMSCRLSE